MGHLSDVLSRTVEALLGRASGPMHLRLLIQPAMASLLAIRAGLNDSRHDHPAFLWAAITNPEARRTLIRSGWKDIGKIFVIAMVLDGIYQLVAMHEFHLVQALLLAVVVAVLPYAVLRGPVNRIARGFAKK